MGRKKTPPATIPKKTTKSYKGGAGYKRGSGKTGKKIKTRASEVEHPINVNGIIYRNERASALAKLDDQRKVRLLEALPSVAFNKSAACRMVGISQPTIYNWLKADKLFKALYNEIFVEQVDFVESQLMRNIAGGNSADIRYFLDRKATDRGYGEKLRIDSTVTGGAFDPSDLDDRELDALLSQLLKKQAENGD